MIRANRLPYAGGIVLGAALVLGGCASQQTQKAEAPSPEDKAAQAVSDAESAVDKTRSRTDDWGLWKSTLGILDNAQNSLEQGDYEAAIEAAEEAEWQADMGLKQYQDQEDSWTQAYQSAKKNGDFPESEWVGAAAEEKGPERASGTTKEVANGTLAVGPDGERGTYTVASGDTLWDIAAAGSVYDDPFAWPLIYKNNSGKIDDPDLIYPEQQFSIVWNVTDEDYNAAVHHAKTRGSWRLGEAEASDMEYLEQY